MTKVASLLDTLSRFDGRIERPTMDIFLREMRTARQLSPTRRGFGAVPLTARDAARLLLATRLTEKPVKAPALIDKYLGLERAAASTTEPPVASLREAAFSPRFEDALTALIEAGIVIEADIQRTGARGLRLRIVQKQQPLAAIEWFGPRSTHEPDF